MEFLHFKNYSLWLNLAIFAASAAAVWLAGTRIATYADAIAFHTGIGHAAVGLILLGGITSLPEVAVALFSSIAGNPVLAVNNLLGGVGMQKALLAACDPLIGKEALTIVVSSPTLLLQAALSVLMLVIVAVAITLGDIPLFGIGIWSWTLMVTYGWSVWMLARSEGRQPWLAQDVSVQNRESVHKEQEAPAPHDRHTLKSVALKAAVAGSVILTAGFLLSQTGNAIADQTGLGQSFVGAVLLALSTSLPELSTVTSAMRMRQYEMAISDIFGTNLFNITLIFLVDAAHDGGPVLSEVGTFSLFAALLAIALTVIYLIGLIERRNHTIGRMGYDSLAALAVYLGGLLLLFRLR